MKAMPSLHGKSELSWIPKGYQKLTIASPSVSGISNPPKSCALALIRVETNDVRWRDDGVNPSATDGMLIQAGETFEYLGEVSAIKFTPISGTATVHVGLYE